MRIVSNSKSKIVISEQSNSFQRQTIPLQIGYQGKPPLRKLGARQQWTAELHLRTTGDERNESSAA